MTHRIRKRRLLAHENVLRQPVPLCEGTAQKVLALAVAVELHFGVDAHDVPDEIEIAEGHARLHRMDADTAVRAQNVVHMQLAHALLRLLLKRCGRGCEVGIFVAEQLVGDLPRQQHADVRGAVDGAADNTRLNVRYRDCEHMFFPSMSRQNYHPPQLKHMLRLQVYAPNYLYLSHSQTN